MWDILKINLEDTLQKSNQVSLLLYNNVGFLWFLTQVWPTFISNNALNGLSHKTGMNINGVFVCKIELV